MYIGMYVKKKRKKKETKVLCGGSVKFYMNIRSRQTMCLHACVLLLMLMLCTMLSSMQLFAL